MSSSYEPIYADTLQYCTKCVILDLSFVTVYTLFVVYFSIISNFMKQVIIKKYQFLKIIFYCTQIAYHMGLSALFRGCDSSQRLRKITVWNWPSPCFSMYPSSALWSFFLLLLLATILERRLKYFSTIH